MPYSLWQYTEVLNWQTTKGSASIFLENITQVAHLLDLNVPELYIVGNLNLQTFPGAIKRLQNIKDMGLHSHNLRELPPEFGQLKQQELLNPGDNCLAQFAQLKKLSKLYLGQKHKNV